MFFADRVKEYAMQLGFHAVGIASVEPFACEEKVLLDRISRGLMDGLDWFTPQRAILSCHPQELLPGARSIISLAVSYLTPEGEPPFNGKPRGRVARYAWGQDYHGVVKERLGQLVDLIGDELGFKPRARLFVDSSPLVDRAVARRAGIGWYGKNTSVFVKGLGSWTFLAAILLDVELGDDGIPLSKNCGTCDLCIRACPTGSITSPYTLDNSCCISFLTIENRGSIPMDLRGKVGDWIFGCDICQEVCPVNRKARPLGWREFMAKGDGGTTPNLIALLDMGDEEFRTIFYKSPVRRAKKRGLQRNAAVALGNVGNPEGVPALTRALENPDEIVRGHAAWALGHIGGKRARVALEKALRVEPTEAVRTELKWALGER